MKAWPIDPLARRDLTLEVSEKLPQGLKQNAIVPVDWQLVELQLSRSASLSTCYGGMYKEATHLVAGKPC